VALVASHILFYLIVVDCNNEKLSHLLHVGLALKPIKGMIIFLVIEIDVAFEFCIFDKINA
jgi:hypothetical protein